VSDFFKTISKASSESLYKEKGSKFLGYAFPVKNEEEIQPFIEKLKSEHHKARHWCYAWRIGTLSEQKYRINDDGEPSGTAGLPIYGQILSKELTDILVVVVRYFGGTKLGVSGLVAAYKIAAQMVLEQAEIITKTIDNVYEISFSYADQNKVLRVLKTNTVEIISQKMELDCIYHISIRKSESERVIQAISELRCVKIVNK